MPVLNVDIGKDFRELWIGNTELLRGPRVAGEDSTPNVRHPSHDC